MPTAVSGDGRQCYLSCFSPCRVAAGARFVPSTFKGNSQRSSHKAWDAPSLPRLGSAFHDLLVVSLQGQ